MPQNEVRRSPALNNPPPTAATAVSLKCSYCEYSTPSPVALRVHKAKYHEAAVAARGEKRAREEGGALKWFVERGMSRCAFAGVLCRGAGDRGAEICNGGEECDRPVIKRRLILDWPAGKSL